MKLNAKFIASAISIIVCLVLGLTVIWGSVPAPKSSDISAYEMEKHIQVISSTEHSVTQVENRIQVMDYIKDKLVSYNLQVEIQPFDRKVTDYNGQERTVSGNNIVTHISGTSPTSVILVAHYDSRGVGGSLNPASEANSKGAADDAYGVSLLLEFAKLYSAKTDLVNSITILFTDLEEIGLYGAKAYVDSNDLSKTNFAINVEARGVKGPAYMFETAANNYKTMQLYNKAKYPLTYSIASAVYQRMPNGTDFTLFVNSGIAGINFSVLDSLQYYHTSNDIFSNINLASMQHYAEQIVPIVNEYVYNDKYSDVNYFTSDRAGVFFTILPGVFILYSDIFAIILTVVTALALAFLIYKNYKKINIKKVLLWIAIIVGSIVAAAIVGIAISLLIGLICGIKFSLTYMIIKADIVVLIIGCLICIAAFVFLSLKVKKISSKEMLFGGMILLWLLNLITNIILVEATFLFASLLIAGLIAIALYDIFSAKNKLWLNSIICFFPLFIASLLLVPLLYTFMMALTVGGMAIYLVLLIAGICVAVPFVKAFLQPAIQVQ